MASENKTEYYEMLDKSLFELYRTGLYSDLTITCQGDTHRVHKAIVCPRSSFFTAACNGNFKEGLEGMINLPDDDHSAVRIMVYYFYNLDLAGYPYIPEDGNFVEEKLSKTEYGDEEKQLLESRGHRFVGRRKVKGQVLKLGARIGPSSNLRLFAKVYALGEKYGIPGLKTIAVGKFKTLAKAYAQTEDFKFAAQEVYTSTIDQDRGLRDVVVKTVEENLGLLNHEAFAAFAKGKSSPPPLFSTNQRMHEYSKDLPAMLKTGQYSDLTIVCGNNRYRVHRNIICARSKFFDVSCDSGFKESNGEIMLPDDDPAAVQKMIGYIYNIEYTPETKQMQEHDDDVEAELSDTDYDASERYRMKLFGAEFVERKTIKRFKERKWASWKVDEFIPSSQLSLHAKVYALGEKYRIEGLKKEAKRKFESEIQSGNVGVDDFGGRWRRCILQRSAKIGA
ncbi:hypothetical protein CEK26_002985 [Fusarium fujikuroi]|nr:hypothetical protein CEK27_002980 [Fusarium fujikuroi]QGJ01541.1 hypothetical protein CEK26_002985 [Fusarium fujikuroi]